MKALQTCIFLAGSLSGLILITGCNWTEAPTDLGEISTFSLAKGNVEESITGNGQFIFRGERKTFAFAAVKRSDGTVTGEFQTFGLSSDLPVHGDVTCFTVIGNQAWIGGVIKKFKFGNGQFEGQDVGWQVIDNREDAADSPDRISFGLILSLPGGILDEETAEEFCQNTPDLGEFDLLNDVVAGNIQIHIK